MYAHVLQLLGSEKDLLKLAEDDLGVVSSRTWAWSLLDEPRREMMVTLR